MSQTDPGEARRDRELAWWRGHPLVICPEPFLLRHRESAFAVLLLVGILVLSIGGAGTLQDYVESPTGINLLRMLGGFRGVMFGGIGLVILVYQIARTRFAVANVLAHLDRGRVDLARQTAELCAPIVGNMAWVFFPRFRRFCRDSGLCEQNPQYARLARRNRLLFR